MIKVEISYLLVSLGLCSFSVPKPFSPTVIRSGHRTTVEQFQPAGC